jgi:hypothetical protein
VNFIVKSISLSKKFDYITIISLSSHHKMIMLIQVKKASSSAYKRNDSHGG